MRNRGIEIFIPSEDTWINDRSDCLSVLMTNSLVDNNLANSIWAGLQNLKTKGKNRFQICRRNFKFYVTFQESILLRLMF